MYTTPVLFTHAVIIVPSALTNAKEPRRAMRTAAPERRSVNVWCFARLFMVGVGTDVTFALVSHPPLLRIVHHRQVSLLHLRKTDKYLITDFRSEEKLVEEMVVIRISEL